VKSYAHFDNLGQNTSKPNNFAYDIVKSLSKDKQTGQKDPRIVKAMVEALEYKIRQSQNSNALKEPHPNSGIASIMSIQGDYNPFIGLQSIHPSISKFIDIIDPEEANLLLIDLKKKLLPKLPLENKQNNAPAVDSNIENQPMPNSDVPKDQITSQRPDPTKLVKNPNQSNLMTQSVKNNVKIKMEFAKRTIDSERPSLGYLPDIATNSLKGVLNSNLQHQHLGQYEQSKLFRSVVEREKIPKTDSPEAQMIERKRKLKEQIKNIADSDLKNIHKLIYMTSATEMQDERPVDQIENQSPLIDSTAQIQLGRPHNLNPNTRLRPTPEQLANQQKLVDGLQKNVQKLLKRNNNEAQGDEDSPFAKKVQNLILEFSQYHSGCGHVCKHRAKFEAYLQIFIQKRMSRQPMKLPVIKFDRIGIRLPSENARRA
jgi:hypothetical protein